MADEGTRTGRGAKRAAAVLLGGLLLVTPLALAVDIQAEYAPNIRAAQKTVIEAKIKLWEGRLPHQVPEAVVKIRFENSDLGADFLDFAPDVEWILAADLTTLDGEQATLAATDNFGRDVQGRPTGARVRINSNKAIKWYEGLEPPVPADKYDLWTVINHELVHALGFTVANPRFARNVANTPGGGREYTGGGAGGKPAGTLTPAADGTHLDPTSHPNDLMNPTVPKGTRRKPSQLDIDLLLDDAWVRLRIEGKLSNFDVWNWSGFIANDFKVTLGGILTSSITSLYNGALNPFSDGIVRQVCNSAEIKWGPGPGQVNPGKKAHFGFKIKGDLTPLWFKFQWTQNNVVIDTIRVNGTAWRRLAGREEGARSRITNPGEEIIWITRRINVSEEPITLDDLLEGMPLEQTAWAIDPQPVPLSPGESLTYEFVDSGSLWGVVMIVDYYADNDGSPGTPLGCWYDAAQLVPDEIHRGDLNCDGRVDFGDINPFILALTNHAGYRAAYPCDRMNADINEDGEVDYGDINPFVGLLTEP